MNRSTQKALNVPISDFRSGDRVRVVDREATLDENKKQIFYNHMRGLTGIVRRVYEQENEIWVDVDRDALPQEVRARHDETERRIKAKWLDGLSDEARRRLSDSEKQFALKYSILVTPDHLILEQRGSAPSDSVPETPRGSASDSAAETPRRATLQDLNSAEKEFLDRARTGRTPQ